MSDGKTSGLKNVYRRWFYRWLAKKYMKDCVVLDVGSGNGFFAKSINDLVPSVIRIDRHPVDDETRGMTYGEWTEPVDVVWASQFIEHVDGIDFMDWACTVSKKYVIIITPNPTRTFWDDPAHIRPYTKKSIKSLFKERGWKVLLNKNLCPTSSHITVAEKRT